MGYFFRIFYTFLLIVDGITNLILGLFGSKYWVYSAEKVLMAYHIIRTEKEIELRNQAKAAEAEKALQTIRSELDKNG